MKRDAQAELENYREVDRLRRQNDTQARRIARYRDQVLERQKAIEQVCEVVADVLAENVQDYEGITRIAEILLPWAEPSAVSNREDA